VPDLRLTQDPRADDPPALLLGMLLDRHMGGRTG
jgi:hypothetical protein